ncbi:MAG: Hydrogenase/urease nickel incorporation protein HypA [Syntrophorhabdus sp. PtaU1.Bin002]|nr:MAG: Hydrogenase/urease nickel incorporation protein HypA [Syntrophorhabdus sp. PtaB.Bin006]OPY73173.1 MAG: Hydrogenase/urease nickel incorporation protein HypA [Syntrophorhabdus sp. PtaU1.Bin002]
MHEVGIVQSALDIAESQARAAGATKIHEIRLRIGQMTGIVPEALEHAMTVLRGGTLAENAELTIEYVPAVCWCATCEKEFAPIGLFGECPDCRAPSTDVRRGMELEIVSLEVD